MCFLNQVPVAIYGFDPDTKERVRLHLDFVAFIISPISTRHLQVPYTDCADVPLEVTLTNSKDFSYVTKSGGQMTKKMLQFLSSSKRQKTAKDFFSTVFSFLLQARGDSNHGGGCVTLQLRGDNPGASTKVGRTNFIWNFANILSSKR